MFQAYLQTTENMHIFWKTNFSELRFRPANLILNIVGNVHDFGDLKYNLLIYQILWTVNQI